MVTKVGSAGYVLDSVISHSNANNRPESSTKEKNEASENKAKASSNTPERVINGSEIVSNRVQAPKSYKKSDSELASDIEREALAVANSDVATESELAKRDANAMELSQEAVKITVEDVNKKLAPTGSSVEFAYHEKTGRYSFKVFDGEGKIIREVPPEKSLDMIAKMFEMAGILVDEKR